MKISHNIICVLGIFFIGFFNPLQGQTAQDDLAELTICNQSSVKIPILDNDQYLCTNPTINIVRGSNIASIFIDPNNELEYTIHCFYSEEFTDSISYSITCDGIVFDTASVFIRIDQTTFAPHIDFNNTLDKTCLAENEEITHTCTIKNNCSSDQKLAITLLLANDGIKTLYDSAVVTINGTVADWTYTAYEESQVFFFTLRGGSEIQFSTKYLITEVTSGKYETTYVEFSGIGFNHTESAYLPVCPSVRNLTITSCDPIPTLNVTTLCSSSYLILQGPSISGNTATIDPNGNFRYTPQGTITTMAKDSVRYEAICSNGGPFTGWVYVDLLPCMDPPTISYTVNDFCNDDPCQYSGPSILINEVMICPAEYDGAIHGNLCSSSNVVGGEWIELYNPDKCNSIDISGYFFANATTDATGAFCSQTRNLGAGFVIPNGTVIPPMGFCILRGGNATPVDPARLIGNGGNVFELVLTNHLGQFCLNNDGHRFWLPNNGGWFGFYDKKGVPQDAIYWGPASADICPDCRPCNPGVGSYTGQLASLDGFSASRKTNILDFTVIPMDHKGMSARRIPDGANWIINSLDDPTMGSCNSTCNIRVSSNCTGTATVVVSGGSGSYSYSWNDGLNQTSPTATNLCEGTYCVTITDNATRLEKLICVTVTNDVSLCHYMFAKNDTVSSILCSSEEFLVHVLQNDSLHCNKPKVTILTNPTIPGAEVRIEQDSLLLYSLPKGFKAVSDSILYEVACESYKDTATLRIFADRDAPSINKWEVAGNTLTFSVEKGTEPYIYLLDDSILIKEHFIENLSIGPHVLRVSDENFCEDSINFNILKICEDIIVDKFFTPDGDGVGDAWNIQNLDCYNYYTVEIYDRHGKRLKFYDNNFVPWDGTYLGNPQPSTDYWYSINIEDLDRIESGHFTLIR